MPARRTEVAERVRAVASRFVLCAHSHIPGAATTGDKMIINPGSVGLPAYEDPSPPCFGIRQPGCPLRRAAAQWGAGEF